MGIYVPARSVDDWRLLLADPEKHWRTGYSARTLAHCWQEAQGFPPCVRKAFQNSGISLLQTAEMLVAIPEHQVNLPGGTRPSQSDLFALVRTSEGLMSMAVEGKVSETFGPVVREWLSEKGAGKEERLGFLCTELGLNRNQVLDCRYQLLHRTASAILEAKRFFASSAAMIVHSFNEKNAWYEDFTSFAALLGGSPKLNSVCRVRLPSGLDLYLGWVSGEKAFLLK